jgi:hypothetical protein
MKNAWNFPFISVLKGKNAYMFTIHLELLFKFLDANNDTHKSIGIISYLYSLMSILFIRNSCAFLFMWTKKKQVYIFFVFLILCFGCTYISFIQFVRLLSNFGVSLTTEINITCALADLITCTQAITSVNRTNSP